MHIREILVIWPKYTHTHTHTQTRTTHANTYTITWLSHRHLNKHRKTTQTHQQTQTRPRGHIQCGQQPHKTRKNINTDMTTCVCVKGMCVYPHGSGMDSGVSLNRTQQKKGNLVHRRRQGGDFIGHAWPRRGVRKKCNNTNRPQKTRKTSQTPQQKICTSG